METRSETRVTVDGVIYYANFWHELDGGQKEDPKELFEFWVDGIDDSPLTEEEAQKEVDKNPKLFEEKVLDMICKDSMKDRRDCWERCRA